MNTSYRRTLDALALVGIFAAVFMQALASPELFGRTDFGSTGRLLFWLVGIFIVVVCGFRFWIDLPKLFYHPTRNAFVAVSLLCLLLVSSNRSGFWRESPESLLWAAWVTALSLWIPVFESMLWRRWEKVARDLRMKFQLPETEVDHTVMPARASLYLLLGAGVAVFVFWGVQDSDWSKAFQSAALFYALCAPFSSRHRMPLIRLLAQIKALRHEIWIRKPEAVDRLEEVTTIAFDKTGTLTQGLARVQQIFSVENVAHKEILQWAVSAEGDTQHPYASGLREKLNAEGAKAFPASQVFFEAGKGVRAQVEKDGKTSELVVGSLVWLYENGLSANEVPQDLLWQAGGVEDSVVWVMKDGQAIGVIVLRDEYRSETASTIQHLSEMGYEMGLITGDSENIAQRFAKELKLKFSHSGVVALEKATVIRRLSEKKKKALDVIYPKVLFVANAQQEQPALQEAHVSWGFCPRSDWEKQDFHILSAGADLKEVEEGVAILRDALSRRAQGNWLELLYHLVFLSWGAGLFSLIGFTWMGSPAIAAFFALLSALLLMLVSVRGIQH